MLETNVEGWIQYLFMSFWEREITLPSEFYSDNLRKPESLENYLSQQRFWSQFRIPHSRYKGSFQRQGKKYDISVNENHVISSPRSYSLIYLSIKNKRQDSFSFLQTLLLAIVFLDNEEAFRTSQQPQFLTLLYAVDQEGVDYLTEAAVIGGELEIFGEF